MQSVPRTCGPHCSAWADFFHMVARRQSPATLTASSSSEAPRDEAPSVDDISSSSAMDLEVTVREQSAAVPTYSGSMLLGRRVEARFKSRETWYAGQVVADNGDGTFEVIYNDGDREAAVPGSHIRMLTAGEADSTKGEDDLWCCPLCLDQEIDEDDEELDLTLRRLQKKYPVHTRLYDSELEEPSRVVTGFVLGAEDSWLLRTYPLAVVSPHDAELAHAVSEACSRTAHAGPEHTDGSQHGRGWHVPQQSGDWNGSDRLRIGLRVEALFDDDINWYPGSISAVHGQPPSTLAVSFDDGDFRDQISLTQIRPRRRKEGDKNRKKKSADGTKYSTVSKHALATTGNLGMRTRNSKAVSRDAMDEEDEEHDGVAQDEEEDDEMGESEYELKRKERMAQNKAFMASLGFSEGGSSLKSLFPQSKEPCEEGGFIRAESDTKRAMEQVPGTEAIGRRTRSNITRDEGPSSSLEKTMHAEEAEETERKPEIIREAQDKQSEAGAKVDYIDYFIESQANQRDVSAMVHEWRKREALAKSKLRRSRIRSKKEEDDRRKRHTLERSLPLWTVFYDEDEKEVRYVSGYGDTHGYGLHVETKLLADLKKGSTCSANDSEMGVANYLAENDSQLQDVFAMVKAAANVVTPGHRTLLQRIQHAQQPQSLSAVAEISPQVHALTDTVAHGRDGTLPKLPRQYDPPSCSPLLFSIKLISLMSVIPLTN